MVKRYYTGYEPFQATSTSNKRFESSQRGLVERVCDPPARRQRRSAPRDSYYPILGGGGAPEPPVHRAAGAIDDSRTASLRGNGVPGKTGPTERSLLAKKDRWAWQDRVKKLREGGTIINQPILWVPPTVGMGFVGYAPSSPSDAGALRADSTPPASPHDRRTAASTPVTRTPQTQEGQCTPRPAAPFLAPSANSGEGSQTPSTASFVSSPHNDLPPTEEPVYTVISAPDGPIDPQPECTLGVNTLSSESSSPPLDPLGISPLFNAVDPPAGDFIVSQQASYSADSVADVLPPPAVGSSDGPLQGAVEDAALHYGHRVQDAMPSLPRTDTCRPPFGHTATTPPLQAGSPGTATQPPYCSSPVAETAGLTDCRGWDAPLSDVASVSVTGTDDGSSSHTSSPLPMISCSPRTDAAHTLSGLAEHASSRINVHQFGAPLRDMPPLSMSGAEEAHGHRQPKQTESSLANWNSPPTSGNDIGHAEGQTGGATHFW